MSRLKIGTKVTIINTEDDSLKHYIGTKGVIEYDDGSEDENLPYRVRCKKDNDYWWFGYSDLEVRKRVSKKSTTKIQDDVLTALSEAANPSGGMKYDDGKLLFSALFLGLAKPLRVIAAVLTYGAQKYAINSWQTVPNGRERYEDAYYRHQNARASGELIDEESGLPHLGHELCNGLFMLWYDIKSGLFNDPYKFNKPPETK